MINKEPPPLQGTAPAGVPSGGGREVHQDLIGVVVDDLADMGSSLSASIDAGAEQSCPRFHPFEHR